MQYIVIGFSRKTIKKIVSTQTTFDAVRKEYEIIVEPGIDETDIFPVNPEGNVLSDPSTIQLVWQARTNYVMKLRRKSEEEPK